MTTNIDDFMDEHLADKAAAAAEAQRIAAEKEEADRKERLAVEQQARLNVNRSRYAIRSAIVQAAIALGSTASTTEDEYKFLIDGIDCSFWLHFVEERARISSWRSKPNGKLRLTVGDFGDRKSYPQKKDGTHNYYSIAVTLRGYAHRRLAEQKAQVNRVRNNQAATDIANEFNLPQYHALVVPSAHVVGNVMIDFSKLNAHTMNPDKARKLLQALRDFGIKLSYNDK